MVRFAALPMQQCPTPVISCWTETGDLRVSCPGHELSFETAQARESCPDHPPPPRRHCDLRGINQRHAAGRLLHPHLHPFGERRGMCCSGEMSTNGLELNGMCVVPGSWSSSVFPVESQDSLNVSNVAFGAGGGAQAGVDATAGEVCSEATSGWTRRVRIGKAPEERDTSVQLAPREAMCRRCQGNCRSVQIVVCLVIGAMLVALKKIWTIQD